MNDVKCARAEKRFPCQEAQPIWLGGECIKNQYVDFIHCFDIEEIASDATMYICVDSEYVLFLNGNFVDCDQYDDYPLHKAYDVLNVTKFLKYGKNRLCIRAYYQGEDSMQYVPGEPMLLYCLQNDTQKIFSNTNNVICRPVKSYESGEQMDKITIQVAYSFHYDADKEDDWLGDNYIPGSEWRKAVMSNAQTGNIEFYERPVKKQLFGEVVPAFFAAQGIMRYDTNEKGTLGHRMQTAFLSSREENQIFDNLPPLVPYRPKPYRLPGDLKIKDGIDSAYIMLEFEDPVSGFFYLDIDAASGTKIDVAFGEHLEDLRVRSSVGGRSYAFSYSCKEGRQRFKHYFRRVGGRYMQLHIHNMRHPAELYYIGIEPVYYPVEATGEFVSKDYLFNEIMSGCDRTLRLCMHEHYEDCPWREQGLYAMDSRNQMLSGYYMYDNSDFSLAGLTLSADNARKDGLLQNCSPCSWPTTMPSFSLEWILSLRDFVLYTGRKEDARPLLAKAKNVLKAVASYFDGKLLVAPNDSTIWNFYEWIDGLDDYDGLYQNRTVIRQYDAPLNALFCYAMKAMHELTEWLDEDWTECEHVENTVRQNFFETFYDSEKNLICSYVDYGCKNGYHELTHAWALLSDLIPVEHCEELCEALASSNGTLIPCTLSFCMFKYEALLKSENFSGVVFDDIAKKWGHMLYSGSRTFWETIYGAYDFENAGSLCHGWAGVAAYFMYAYFLGVRPTKPGYEEYEVNPVKLGQTVRGKVSTPIGTICVEVEHGEIKTYLKTKI